MTHSLIIKNGDVFTPSGPVKAGVLVIKGRKIVHIGKSIPAAYKKSTVINARGKLILPGFIDTHCHGGAGYDCVGGKYLKKTDSWDNAAATLHTAVSEIAKYHAAHGTTGVVLATTAAPDKKLLNAVRTIGAAAGDNSPVLGSHIEGTFLDDPAYAGAQSAKYFKKPSLSFIKKLIDASDGTVKIVNVTPDTGKAALALIRFLKKQGIVSGIGHAGCTYKQYMDAVKAGASLHIHLGNGPTRTAFKPDGFALEGALTADAVTGELIMDGFHLNPRYVADFMLAKDLNVTGITDCMFASGMKGLKRFTLGTEKGMVTDKGKRLAVAGSPDALFGSTLTMNRAFANLVSWLITGIRGVYHREVLKTSFDRAVQTGCLLFSENPAKVLGIHRRTGRLMKGKDADIVICDRKFNVSRVFIRGSEIEKQAKQC